MCCCSSTCKIFEALDEALLYFPKKYATTAPPSSAALAGLRVVTEVLQLTLWTVRGHVSLEDVQTI